MNSIERLEKFFNGEPVDRPPFSFWHHFGLQHMKGESVGTVHIAFARRYHTDFIKVMNDYPYPVRDGLSLDRMSDVYQLSPLKGIEGGWNHQLLCLKTIHAAMSKERWIIDTIYSPWTILCRLFGVDNVIRAAGSRPEYVQHGLEVITQSLINYINEARPYINGIYFSMTEADYMQLNPMEHLHLCFNYNKRVLDAAKGLPFNVLRLKGNRVFFESVRDYESAAVSWEHFRTHPGIAKGLLAWQRPMLGGINGDEIHSATPASIKDRFERYADEYLLKGLIIAPTGSLRTNVSPYVLEAISAGVNELARFNVSNSRRNNVRELSKVPGMEREFSYFKMKKEEAEREAIANRKQQEVTQSVQTKKFFPADVDFQALAAEANGDENVPEVNENAAVADVATNETAPEAVDSVPVDNSVPDVEFDSVDDIYANDFEVADEEGAEATVDIDDEGFDDDMADDEYYDEDGEYEPEGDGTEVSADENQPRQAWKERGERRGSSRDRFERRRPGGRDNRGGYGNRNDRGGYGNRDRRGGYGNRNDRGGYGNRDNRGGYGNRDDRGGYGNRDNRGGYGNRDDRGGYGNRDNRGGYGNRDDRGGYGNRGNRGGFGNRDDRGGYGNRGNRGGYGTRNERGGYGNRDNRGGYGNRDDRFSQPNHKVIRVKRQK